jgi:hypothetical protein
MSTPEEQLAALLAENAALMAKPAKSDKPRQMSPKGFLHKTNTKAAHSAIAFLAAHREWLVTGELSDILSPIVQRMDQGALLPTPALREIQQAVMNHIIASDIGQFEKAMEDKSKPGKQKTWVATIRDLAGNICTRINPKGEVEELVMGFDLSSAADRWVDRRLFDGAPDWYGEVAHTTLTKVKTYIQRQDAIARILRKPKGPSVHSKGNSTKTLGFGSKAHQTRVTFSHG